MLRIIVSFVVLAIRTASRLLEKDRTYASCNLGPKTWAQRKARRGESIDIPAMNIYYQPETFISSLSRI